MSYLFDSYAKIYNHFMRLFHLDDTSVIEHKLSKGQYHILDVGGGSGTLAADLQAAGHQVTIVDSSLSMLKEAKKKNTNVKLIHASIQKGLPINKVDVIICRDCLHHLMNQEKCLKLMLNYLNNNGFILIHDFNQRAFRIKLLFLFERCCFEKIKPVKPEQLVDFSLQNKLNIVFLHQGKWDYICMLKKEK